MSLTATVIILAALTMLGLAVVMSFILGWANRAFHVQVDPRVEKVNEVLPGANCGGCGYVGCNEYAEAVVADPENVPVNLCAPGGESCAQAIANILGVEVEQSWPYRAVVHCTAAYDQRLGRTDYRGERTCAAANIISGIQGCTYGCLGFGDCFNSCDFDAIDMVDGLPRINYQNCTGCGACIKACPRNIISRVPFKADRMLVVACCNKDPGPAVKKVCTVGCIGCKACQRVTDIFNIKDNVATIDYQQYDPSKQEELDAALGKCPAEAMIYVGLPSEQDIAATADEELPERVTDNFKTTADDAEWRG
jgi:RnfABCDGE-type electron transport complex B subunit